MKTLNITFEDNEYNELNRLKEEEGLNWREFILVQCGISIKRKLGKKKIELNNQEAK